MNISDDDLTIVWIGRFLHKGGYGAATRSIYRALRESSIHTIGIDLGTLRPIDDSVTRHFSFAEDEQGAFTLRSNEPERRVIAVVHDVPSTWDSVQVSGAVHLAGYTYTETEQIPFGWTPPMLGVDQVFVATDFNKASLVSAGMPEAMLSVLPTTVDTRQFSPRSAVIPMRGANSFRFLSSISALDRKDMGRIVRAYCDAFSADDDVSLIVKFPLKFTKDDFSKYLVEAVFPWIDLNSDSIPHIMAFSEDMTDEKLIELYASCHAFISLERGKGWDLPSLEAMLMGLPCIGIDWGGSTQFQNRHNARLIEPLPTTFASDDLVSNQRLYSGHTWASFDVTHAAREMRRVRENFPLERARVLNARPELERICEPATLVEAVGGYASRLMPFNFRSNAPASIALSRNANAPNSAAAAVRRTPYEALDGKTRDAMDQKFQAGDDLDAWVMARRRIWSKAGPVLPPEPELERTRRLRNSYLGESIFIVGNGPSLNKVDMARLENHYTFAANRIYLLFERTSWRPDFYTTLDWRVAPDNFHEINHLRGMTFFFPHRFRGLLREGADVFWYESLSPGRTVLEKFEPDIAKGARGGGTVLTAALQLAWYLGFRRFFLIGVDASYTIPASVVQSGGDRFGTGTQINLESRANDDPNHFDPRYFGAGAKWHDPNVDEMKRGFLASRRAIEFLGGEIYNATEGGSLDCIPRMAFDDALRSVTGKERTLLRNSA